MRISDWSSDVCSSDLPCDRLTPRSPAIEGIDTLAIEVSSTFMKVASDNAMVPSTSARPLNGGCAASIAPATAAMAQLAATAGVARAVARPRLRSEEHTSELQSLMRHSYAVFCL